MGSPAVTRAAAWLFIGAGMLSAQDVTISPPQSYPVGNVPEAIAFGDLDGNGILDVAVANSSADGKPGGDSVSVLLGSDDGTLAPHGSYAVGRRPEGIQLLDADDDGVLDAVTADWLGDSVSILLGDGTGGLSAPSTVRVPGGPRFVVAADFTGDGAVDLVTANFSDDSIAVLAGDGAGGFTPLRTTAVKDGPEVVAVARLDDDAELDLVTANVGHGSITPLAGDGTGRFRPQASHRVGKRPRFVIARDLDGDGLDDLVVANHDDGYVSIERNRGDFTFERAADLSGEGLVRPVYLDVADIDGDERLDVLATWVGSDVFTVFRGGEEPFVLRAPLVIATGSNPVGIAVKDLDADGTADIIVSNALEDTVFLYHASAQPPPGRPFLRGDSNADGEVNLSDAVSVLSFLFQAGDRPTCMRAADSSGNGAVSISDAVYLLLHLLLGGPSPPPPFPGCGEDRAGADLTCDAYPPCETHGDVPQ
jgi:hypothetical protein